MKIVVLLGAVIVLLSCKKEPQVASVGKTDSLVTKSVDGNEYEDIELILNKFPFKKIPAVDSTNFYYVSHLKPLADADVQKLGLNTLFEDGSQFQINSRYELQPDFKTITVTFHKGEMEITTQLLNFDKQGRMIDHVEIAYDEIAESAFRKSSHISKDKIVLTDENYLVDPAKIQEFTYKILPSGKIKK